MNGRVTNLFLKPGHGSPMAPTERVRAVESCGLEGDVAYGSTRRQVLLVDAGVLAEFHLEPGSVRENITADGLRFSDLVPGTRLEIGEAVLEVTSDCAPCEFLDSLRSGLQRQLEGQRGVLANVVRSGTIQVGDRAQVVSPNPSGSGD